MTSAPHSVDKCQRRFDSQKLGEDIICIRLNSTESNTNNTPHRFPPSRYHHSLAHVIIRPRRPMYARNAGK